MGIPPEHEAEFNDWYNTEHVPALTSVPGCMGPGVTALRRLTHVPGDV